MSKNPAFSQKILEDWLTLPERQELFAGLHFGHYGFDWDQSVRSDHSDHPGGHWGH